MSDMFNQVGANDLSAKRTTKETIITEDTVIVGTIAADSSLIISGRIKGDVFSKNSIELQGKVDGNMTANDITITDGAVKGDINSDKNILVSGDSIVVGNLFGRSLEFNGKIKGNVRIDGHAVIRENAVIQGNLSACNFTVDDGAKIIGFVEIIKTAEVTGQPTESIEDIVNFADIEIPSDAGKPEGSEVPEPQNENTSLPLFTTVSAKEELVVAPTEEVVEKEEEKVEEPKQKETEKVEEEEKEESSDDDIDFADEKQKMLNDLRSRMEKAKKSGQSL